MDSSIPATEDPFLELGKGRRHTGRIVAAVLVVIALVAVVLYRRRAKPKTMQYVTAAATLGSVQETVETSGTVQPITQVQVGSQASGRLSRVLVDFNDRVRAGQLLAEIDPTTFRAAIAQARAQLLSAEAQLQRARASERLSALTFQRATDMRAQGFNAQADVDQARGGHDVSIADVAVANAEIARARATLASAETNLGFTRIVAPIDGIVIQRSVDEGQTVAASFQAPVLFQIAADLAQMRIIANIDEADIARMREHLAADARVDAFPGEVFRGEVSEVRYGSTTTSGVVTYPAVVTLANPDLKLRPGMTATITVTSNRHENVLRVPNAALRYRPGAFAPDTGTAPAPQPAQREEVVNGVRRGTVYVLRAGRPAALPVRIGLIDETLTEVAGDGLNAGAQVVTDEIDLTPASSRPGAAGMGARGGAGGGGGRR